MNSSKFICPYCKGEKRLLYTGERCPACNGFGIVDEMGRRRAETMLKMKKSLITENRPIRDDWGGECPF